MRAVARAIAENRGMAAADPLALNDEALLKECQVETFRASGPGGQHRNKTDSAVRLRHLPTGVMAQAYESRSQHENRALALERLRAAIALSVRAPVDLQGYHAPPELLAILPLGQPGRIRGRNAAFWPGVRALLDLLVANELALAPTAPMLGISSGQLSRLLTSEPSLLATVNALRGAAGLHPLRG